MAARVVILGDVRLFRDGLAALLRGSARIEMVATIGSPEEACTVIARERPDVLLFDMSMPDALRQVSALAATFPTLKIVTLAIPETATDVLFCAEAGAVGYVPREASAEDLIAALEAAARSELRCPAHIAAALLRRVAELTWAGAGGVPSSAAPTAAAALTLRELEVLRLLETGRSNKEIARALGIELAMAKNHVHNILAKLELRRRTQLIPRATRWMPPGRAATAEPPRDARPLQRG
jgi:two-component system, NarL family, nitrate/nitrite response regulator NarL